MTYTKYPQACKALIAYMLEADNYNKWLEASVGYLTHPLNAYDANPVWTADPKNTIFREAAKRTLTAGGLGSVGEKAASALADFIVLDMFANCLHRPRGCQGCDQGRRAPGDAALPLRVRADAGGASGAACAPHAFREVRLNGHRLPAG